MLCSIFFCDYVEFRVISFALGRFFYINLFNCYCVKNKVFIERSVKIFIFMNERYRFCIYECVEGGNEN